VIIIPAAGHGRRFAEAGYSGPKHLIPLCDQPLIDWVVENVRYLDPKGTVFIADQNNVGQTKGAMETIQRALVQARPAFNDVLVIANCDQLIAFPEWITAQGIGHGLIFTFKSASPAHSYVTTDERGRIIGIVEKPLVPPSDKAVSGVYMFTNPHAIQTAIKDCLAETSDTPEGEQYLSRAIQRMIDQEYTLYAIDAPTAILGTPEDFQRFETALEVLEWDSLRSRA
jgi:dTDP-glucose pyrophosphorylase